jgi:hypothetical protein
VGARSIRLVSLDWEGEKNGTAAGYSVSEICGNDPNCNHERKHPRSGRS